MSNLNYKLNRAIKGNTWPGLNVTFSSDGTTFDDDVASAKFTVVDSGGTAVLSKTSGSGITINDASAWDITVDAIPALSIDGGVYSWALEITDAGGVVRTWLAGTWTIWADAVT